MKRILILILGVLAIVLCASACSKNNSQSESRQTDGDQEEPKESVTVYDRYDINTYLKPFWEGKIVYNETVMFVGEDDKAPLMYNADEIISVRSYDLTTEYEEGVDYVYDKKTNSIMLTADTNIPYLTVEEYYPSSSRTDGPAACTFPCTRSEYNYIWFQEGNYFSSKQIAVTYRHSGTTYLAAPDECSSEFNEQVERLQNKNNAKILFFGDSITVGANASSYIGYGPYAQTWTWMVYDKLVDHYGLSATYYNYAVGGRTTQQGIDNMTAVKDDSGNTVDLKFAMPDGKKYSCVPDMLFLAFGMNDGTLSVNAHISKIQQIAETVLEANPNCIICLVSTMLPNSEVVGFYGNQVYYHEKYAQLAQTLENKYEHKIFFADVTKEHIDLLKYKRYYDCTANNVNHPNDFISRLYAQTVLYTLCGDDYMNGGSDVKRPEQWDARRETIIWRSFDQLYAIDEYGTYIADLFAPGQSDSWDNVADMSGISSDKLVYWGWVSVKGELGTFGYKIDGESAVYDDGFTNYDETLLSVYTQLGGDTGSRMRIVIDLSEVSTTSDIAVLYKDTQGREFILSIFTVVGHK